MVKGQTRTHLGLQSFELQFELLDLVEQGIELLVAFCPRTSVILRNFDADWLFHGAKVTEKVYSSNPFKQAFFTFFTYLRP